MAFMYACSIDKQHKKSGDRQTAFLTL